MIFTTKYMLSINITICSDKWPKNTANSSKDTYSKTKILMPWPCTWPLNPRIHYSITTHYSIIISIV